MGIIPPSSVSALSTLNYSNGDVSGVVEQTIALTGVSITSDDPSVSVRISTTGNGILSFGDTTGLSFSTSDSGQLIGFSGDPTDVNNALATLRYRTLDAATATISVVLSEANEIFYPGNGHMYEVVNNGSGISWDDAKIAAEARTKNGAAGYLATMTSSEENNYVSAQLTGSGWFGASDAATEDDWQWVTGPETGTSFWAGQYDGAPVESRFSNWSGGEPNNSGEEDCGQFYTGGSGWNDLPCDTPSLDYYIVEYGAEGDLPTEPENISFDVTTTFPVANEIMLDNCLEVLDVYANGTDNRYDTLRMSGDIDCTGEDIEPLFSQSDPDFGIIGFRGEFDGQGYTLSNVTIENPGDSSVGLFSVTNGASIHDVTIGGSVVGDSCVGGLVGEAYDTNFDNVTSGMTVQADYYVAGGIVGCMNARVLDVSITDASLDGGTVVAQESVGGIIGDLDIEEDATVTITGNTYNGDVESMYWATGGIIGTLESSQESVLTMNNNSFTNPIDALDASGVGGMIGYAYIYDDATVTISENTISGTITADSSAGGVVGDIEVDSSNAVFIIEDQVTSSDVTSDDGDSVGGLVGEAYGLTINRSSTSGDISGADDRVGGLVGELDDSEIAQSFATGVITASDSRAGGLVGQFDYSEMIKSYATGNVTGDDSVGGLVGDNYGTITDSYARGSVTGTVEVGSVAGECGGTLTNVYGTGLVTADSDFGGLIGYDDSCGATDSFWDMETTGQEESPAGLGKTTEQMKFSATFAIPGFEGLEEAWDMETIWGMNATVNDGYPCLQWQSEDCDTPEIDDADGVSEAEEAAAPNGGDANNDGAIDSLQPKVTSIESDVSGKYVVLESTDCSANEDVTITSETTTASQDDDSYQYPAGLLSFTLTGCTVGVTETITQYYYGDYDAAKVVVRKYDTTDHSYVTIESATKTNMEIGGQKVLQVVYTVTDGGDLDADGTANGTIVDPAGVAVLADTVVAPSTGFGQAQTWVSVMATITGLALVAYAVRSRSIRSK